MSAESTKEWKQALYGKFYDSYDKTQGWRTNFAKKAAHQALDLPFDDDEDMQVTSTNVRNGITWKELIAAGVLGLGGFGVYQYFQNPASSPVAPADTNTQYLLEVDRDQQDQGGTDQET